MSNRPFGIHSIANMWPTFAQSSNGGRWVRAVAQPYEGNRLVAAWWVLTGRAYAVEWPEDGDIEEVLGI